MIKSNNSHKGNAGLGRNGFVRGHQQAAAAMGRVAAVIATEAASDMNPSLPGDPILKVEYYECGCRSHICLAKGKADKPCTRSCEGCSHSSFMTRCHRHAFVKAGELRTRLVNIGSEVFH